MTIVGVFVLASIAGLVFCLMRSRWPLAYGFVELAVAFGIIYFTYDPQNYDLLYQEPPWWASKLSKSLGFIAGVYVIVRGLDNIERGLWPSARNMWRRVFYAEVQKAHL
jgi:hypothetical protein